MKKIILFILMLMALVPVFSDDAKDPLEWGKNSSGNYTRGTHTFDVIFDGAEWAEIGFSSTTIGFSKGTGVTKSSFTNNSITMVKNTTSSSSTSSYTYNVTGDIYIYWYISVKEAMNLVLKVSPNSVTSGGATIYDKNKVTVKVTPRTYTSTSAYTSGKEITIVGDKSEASEPVVVFPTSYAVYQGDIKINSVEAEVSAFPTNRIIGKLTLVLRTNA